MITTGDWPDALEPIANVHAKKGYEQAPAEKDMFFEVKEGKKLTETYLEMGDIGVMGELTGSVAYDDISQGYKYTVTAKEFSKGIKIQRRFVETDQQDVVEGLPKKLGESAHNREATDIFFMLNNAFNTSFTTLDGLQLCSAAHTSNNGGSTQSNRGTTALSAVAVEASRIKMKRFLTNKDNRLKINPDTLIVPEDLYEAAYEIINANGKVDTATNNPNFHKGKYNLIHSIWLDDTNNWFVADSKMMKQCNEWRDIVKLEFNMAKNFDDYAAKYSAYMFYLYTSKDWRWLFGNEVS
jgi:phage major head subunit gpT-like protein